MSSDLLVFCPNYNGSTNDLYCRSCDLQNIKLHGYGEGKNWPGFTIGKIQGPLEFLKTRDEPFVMFGDGHDTIIIDTAETILDKFQRFGYPVLFSAEKNCWPDATLAKHFPFPKPPYHNSPWRFPNAGGWMGQREAVIDMLTAAWEYNNQWQNDDTRCFVELYLKQYSWRSYITFDYGCQIFQTMCQTHSHELGPNGENLVTHNKPSTLHFNGRVPGIGLWYRTLTGDLGWKGE